MSKFDKEFSEPVQFHPYGWHVSRVQYDRDQAALEISREIGEIVDPERLKESQVRFQFASADIRVELDITHCWMVVSDSAKRAQPTWEYIE